MFDMILSLVILGVLSPDCAFRKEGAMSHSSTDWTLADSKIVTAEEVRTILGHAKKLGEIDPNWLRDYDFFAVAVHTSLVASW